MSLVNQTAWIVGGVGVVGRGITRGLLQAGCTVIVNSRSEDRLNKLQESLEYPERLITVHGSLLPGLASNTVRETLENRALDHVVAHGAVRWWARPSGGTYSYYEYRAGCDETYSLNIKASERLLEMPMDDFKNSSAQLSSLHLSAAQALMPRLNRVGNSYTFVTGDGSGKPGGDRTAMGEINSHHIWGLSSAIRHEVKRDGLPAVCREVRVGLPVTEEHSRPVSEDVGHLCAGLASASTKAGESGRLIKLDCFETLDTALEEYNVDFDGSIAPLPHHMCEQHGALSGSL